MPRRLAGSQGRCPKCAEPVSVPLADAPVLDQEASGVQELAPAAPLAGRRSCAVCGKKLEPKTVVCTGCGTHVLTGEKLAGGARDLLSEEERLAHREEQQKLEFRGLVRGVLLHPLATLQTISFQLSFPETTLAMTRLWLVSLLAIGALGGLLEQMRARKSPTGPLAAGTERRFQTTIERADVYILLYPARPVAGELYRVERAFANITLPGRMTYGLGPRGAAPDRRYDFDRPPPRGKPPLAPAAGDGTLEIVYHPPGGKPITQTFDVPLTGPIARSLRIGPLARGALRTILLSAALLLAWTALLSLGGRVMTGEFKFVPLLVALAFLQGVTNLAYLPLLPFLPWIGPSFYLLVYLFLLWTALLYFLTIMQLYELDPRGAGLVVFGAVGVLYVAWFLYNKAGMV